MKRITVRLAITFCTFIIGISAVVFWFSRSPTNQSNIAFINNEPNDSATSKVEAKELTNDFSPVIELWLKNKIKGNKVQFSVENDSIVGELIQLNAGREKELIVTTCPNQNKEYNPKSNPKCDVTVYEKYEKSYKKLLYDNLDWQYGVRDGEMIGGIFGRWGKGHYKDLHIVANGTENIYIYNGSEYKFQQQITYTA